MNPLTDRDTDSLARECLIIADWNVSALPLTPDNREVIRELANRVLQHGWVISHCD